MKLSANTIPRGFRFAATACGLKKKGGLDLALVTCDRNASAAAVFTQNLLQAAPVILSRQHVKKSPRAMRAIVVNSGNANCSTGTHGMKASLATAKAVAREVDCNPEQVIVCSTGVIGVPMRVERILRKLPELTNEQASSPQGFGKITRAIMTTDTCPKWAAATCKSGGKTIRIIGCAKGAGMIHPQMATMLAFVLTDAEIAPALLQRALREVAGRTFNRITVDGDTSTNDTLAILASGASGGSIRNARNYADFVVALERVCKSLALAIVADGEGAKRVVQIDLYGAPNAKDADCAARTIANSPLVKTALAGADPNWGRILAAAGRSGVRFDPDKSEVWLAGIKVYSRGRALPFDERIAHRKMLATFVPIRVNLNAGKGAARMWTCDFTMDYVHINASYRT
ncbi:MAG: bifunctional glutamate N-acetyltransferase/amino-acid acetyltransferase ArgJ [Acidobacteria bacterium]|nr:bifunctional glutamate N-acetyltransferase/amino-acid acetyltransferase ArgJ [Acidobacteriota bacterium]